MTRTMNSLGRRGQKVRRKIEGDAVVDQALKADAFMALLEDATHEWGFGMIWARPGLDLKMRAAAGLTMIACHGMREDIKSHVRLCLRQGWTPMEIGEILLHFLVYAGFPKTRISFSAAHEVFVEQGVPLPQSESAQDVGSPDADAQYATMAAEGRRIRNELFGGEFVSQLIGAAKDPFMDIFNDATHAWAFGVVWTRPALDVRTRTLLTLAAAAASGAIGGVNRHVRSAITAGVSPQEIGEIFLQAYYYSGAPGVSGSFLMARDVMRDMAQETAKRK